MKIKKVLWEAVKLGLSVLIMAGIAGYGWGVAHKNEDYKIINILASREPDLALRVYAQFNVSQVVLINEKVLVTRLVIPMYTPAKPGPVIVSWRDEENAVIKEWQLDEYWRKEAVGSTSEVVLPFGEARWLEGKYIVNINGRGISNEEQEEAPRVFVEKDDSKYPEGHYLIADNVKAGDVSLQIMAQRPMWQRYWDERRGKVGRLVLSGVASLMVIMVLVSTPYVILRR